MVSRRLTPHLCLLLLVCAACNSPVDAAVPTIRDPSFGSEGFTVTDIGGPENEDEPFTLIMTRDGKFLAPGKAFNPSAGTYDFVVLRYQANGLLDPSFSGEGIALTDFGAYEEAQGIAEQADGKIVAGGFTRRDTTDADFALTRYNQDGTLDPSFGDGGRVTTDFLGSLDQMLTLSQQQDGKIVAAGFAADPAAGGTYNFALARYNVDGSLDTSFGSGGKVVEDFYGGHDHFFRMLIQPDGKIVCVGSSVDPNSGGLQRLVVARYEGDGSPDATFGPSEHAGRVTAEFYGRISYGFTAALLPDGRLLAAGLTENPASESNDMALIRYLPDGRVDTSFAPEDEPGFITVDFFGDYDQILALAIQPDGKILAAGHAKHPTRHFELAVARFTQGGQLDASFGNGGKFTVDLFGGADGLHGVVLQPDGRAVLAGDGHNPATAGDDFVLMRLLIADVEWTMAAAEQLGQQAYESTAARNDLAAVLTDAQAELDAGRRASAVERLIGMRTRLDGCGTGDPEDDWIRDCAAQYQIRALVEQVVYKLND